MKKKFIGESLIFNTKLLLDKKKLKIIKILDDNIWNLDDPKIPKKYRKDKDLVYEVMAHKGDNWVHIDSKFMKDKKMFFHMLKIGSAGNLYCLSYAHKSLKNDRSFILKILKNCSFAASCASDSLKKNKSFILKAIKLQSESIKYADDILLNDRSFILKVVSTNGRTFTHISKILQRNDTGNKEPYKKYYKARISEINDYRKDEEIVIAATSNYPPAINYANLNLKNKLKNN